jgi:GNAT superfamily N-acetyltransferase
MKFKRANYRDMHKIADIIRSSASWYEPFLEEKDMKEHDVGPEWIKENFEKRHFYLAETPDEKKEVGTVSMQFFGKQTYLGYVYLKADETGKGYGKKLIEFAKEHSKDRGQESMILIAHPEATWATRAYKKFGFKKKCEKREEVLSYKDGLLEPYYEEGFHLYEYQL